MLKKILGWILLIPFISLIIFMVLLIVGMICTIPAGITAVIICLLLLIFGCITEIGIALISPDIQEEE